MHAVGSTVWLTNQLGWLTIKTLYTFLFHSPIPQIYTRIIDSSAAMKDIPPKREKKAFIWSAYSTIRIHTLIFTDVPHHPPLPSSVQWWLKEGGSGGLGQRCEILLFLLHWFLQKLGRSLWRFVFLYIWHETVKSGICLTMHLPFTRALLFSSCFH